MSAQRLLQAAASLREDWSDCDCHKFERAVADLLEYEYFGLGTITTERLRRVFAVADAYLGQSDGAA